ncbi:glutathione peroxidase [Oleiphilus sp. HI0009]|nr:glutathione peroxidase [Oleiphilus sp. HI0009]
MTRSARTILCFLTFAFASQNSSANACPEWLNIDIGKLHSQETLNLCEITSGKNVLIVNTASHCGFTPQFKELQALYEKYENQNFTVIGFTSNSFRQAAKSEEKAAEVCFVNFGVKFTMTETVDVRGSSAHPVFKELSAQSSEPRWNFNKYLVNTQGEVVEVFGSSVRPNAAVLSRAIDNLL